MNHAFVKDGRPDVARLQSIYNRCTPAYPGGTESLDNSRFCRWANQWSDGKKHDAKGDPNGAALPWNGASDCRPFVVDAIINERVAMKTTAFWQAMLRPGMGNSEEGAYAVALGEHLLGSVLYDELTREVELSAQYEEHYGWMVLAPRWRRELGLRRHEVSMQYLLQAAAQLPEQHPLRQLPLYIADPSLEQQAIEILQQWYEYYVGTQLPEDVRERAPAIKDATMRKAVRELREKGKTSVPLPYLCKDEPEICALRPWDEVFIPPEMTDEQTLVFQREWVSEAELRGRTVTHGYNDAWVEAACEQKGTA